MNVLGRNFVNSRKDSRKDVKTEFFLRCRSTYVLNKSLKKAIIYENPIKPRLINCNIFM